MLFAEPYVPATVRKVPITITNMDQQTIKVHLHDRSCLPLVQWSYSHMHPIGWKEMRVPSKAPTSETSPSKTGMALAMT